MKKFVFFQHQLSKKENIREETNHFGKMNASIIGTLIDNYFEFVEMKIY
jgi:hypothetical protein